MAVALGVLFMTLGVFIEALDVTSAMVTSMIMIFICAEVRGGYPWMVWLATSLLGALFYTASLVWVLYLLIFGLYPILKAFIERLKRPLWWAVKLGFFALASAALIAVSELILGIPFYGEELNLPILEGREWIMKAAVYALLCAGLMLYDAFLTILIRAYYQRLRPAMKNILK